MSRVDLLLIACFSLQIFWLSCAAAVLLPQDEANSVLRRQRRFNTGGLEELRKGNLERECMEERCSWEEAREVFENVEKTMEFWAKYEDGDQCQSSPCRNAGQCVDSVSSYTCLCQAGFMGTNCEISMVRKCNVKNGGCTHFCIDVSGGRTCTCAAGYQLGQDGATCEPKGDAPCGTLGMAVMATMNSQTVKAQDGVQPAQQANAARGVINAGNKPAPVVIKPAPVVINPAPLVVKLAPVANSPAPGFRKLAPVDGKPALLASNHTPVVGNATLAAGSPPNVVGNPTSVAGKPAPVVSSPTPVGNKTILTFNRPTVVGNKPTPEIQGELPTSTEQDTDSVRTRIVGGYEVIPGEIPWQVALVDQETLTVFCGGSILSERWVVTAAHCLSEEMGPFFIRAGEHNLKKRDGTEQDVGVAERLLYPQYNATVSRYKHDIALLRTQTSIRLTEAVRPICLGPQAFTEWLLQEGAPRGRVSGWGRLKYGGATSPVLRKVDLPFVERTQCKASSSERITHQMFCAGSADEPKDACQGDSGGPYASRRGSSWFLTGIVSWGEECGAEGKYGVYTRVSYYSPWIAQVMGLQDSPAAPPRL
ncbi:coagulation factor IXa [Brienomyrus brachyistius]|uniref:coagulation factor IXa n=1 Tax=Brienomyrus brachyistius TaxID=42636 RepID=UPI0020B34302|nr:coagulation factor IXa [Brienomyrus brachyistius]